MNSRIFLFLTIIFLLSSYYPSLTFSKTPAELDAVIEKFKTETNLDTKLDLSYQGLDLYDSVPKKSEAIDGEDRTPLCEMKRLIIIDLMRKNKFDALPAMIGTGGTWMLNDRIKNDYDARKDEEVAKYKHQGYYMEGLSDLDFVIMGPQARDFAKQLYTLLAEGRNGVNLDYNELENLEISFLVDDQISDISPQGDRRKFWKQMLDLSRSAPHPEKYITKGGKALYCVEHLWMRGSVLKPGPQPQAMPFKTWSDFVGFDVGPFTPQYLYGGCCDMDYFMRHALEKTKQEKIKTVLQFVKYLERQTWMLDQAEQNSEALAGNLKIKDKHIEYFKTKAAQIEKFCENSIHSAVWRSDAQYQEFVKKALDISADVCITAHGLSIGMGTDLLLRLDDGELTLEQAILLDEIAYDLKTVHSVRYVHGRPSWYESHQATIIKETEDFLNAYEQRKPRTYKLLAKAGIVKPKDEILTTTEIGPLEPPPVVTLKIKEITIKPSEPQAGEKVEVTIKGALDNVLKEKPNWEEPWLSEEQQKAIEQVGIWSWHAAVRRMQISHLIKTDQENRQKTKPEDFIYVSPFEIQSISRDELEICEDEVATNSEKLGINPPKMATGQFKPNLRSQPTMGVVEEYIKTLDDTFLQTHSLLEYINSQASVGVKILENIKGECSGELSTAYQMLLETRDSTNEILAKVQEYKEGFDKYKGYAESFSKVVGGDFWEGADKAKELEEFLEKMAGETEVAIWDATATQNVLANAINLFRMSARTVDTYRFPGLHDGLMKSIREYDAKKNEVMLKNIPQLEERAKWIERGAYAATAVKWAFRVAASIKEFQDAQEKLSTTDLSSETQNAVLSLKVCGEIISRCADKLPLPVLRQAIKDYASLLTSAPQWSAAFDTLMRRRAQGMHYDVSRVLLPAAYEKLINQNPTKLDPGEFYRYEGPFAAHNNLIIFGHPVPDENAKKRKMDPKSFIDIGTDQLWLVWDKNNPDGFIKLDDEGYRQASLYAAYFRRVKDKQISGTELHDLLTKGKIEGMMFIGKDLSAKELQFQAEAMLRLMALKDYLGLVTGKEEFSLDELRRYYAMLDHAARHLAKASFIMTDYDVKDIIEAIKPEAAIGESWSQTLRKIPVLNVIPDVVNKGMEQWNSLSPVEQSHFTEIVAELIKKKQKLRAEAREKFFTEKKEGTAAGLVLDEINLTFDCTLVSPKGRINASATLKPQETDFSKVVNMNIPESFSEQSALVCRIGIVNYPKARADSESTFVIQPKLKEIAKPAPQKIAAPAAVSGVESEKPAIPACPPEPSCPIPAGAKRYDFDTGYGYLLNDKIIGPKVVYYDYAKTKLRSESGVNERGEGYYRIYHEENGKLAEAFSYKNNDTTYFHGRRAAYFKNGTKSLDEVYIEDEYRATSHWWEDGTMSYECINDGQRYWSKSYYNGKPDSEKNEILVKHALIKHGKQIRWHENGQKAAEEYYKEGLQHGKFIYWNDKGQKTSEMGFKDGKLHGIVAYWTDKGVPTRKEEYKDGERHGTFLVYYDDGKLRIEEQYKDGKRHGKNIWYFANGKIDSESHCENGKLQGPYVSLDETGRKVVEGNYANDQRHGEFRFYRKDGKVEKIEIFEKDICIETKSF